MIIELKATEGVITMGIRVILASACLWAVTAGAEPSASATTTQSPVVADESANHDGLGHRRLQRSLGVSYRSNWFLLGGFRVAKRLGDARNEFAVQYGKSVLRGCAIQAPMCEQGDAFTVGARRYLWTGLFSPYAGTNVHYLAEGIRFREVQSLLVDVDAGLHWQTLGGAVYGLGWTFFLYDPPTPGFSPVMQGWLHTQIGRAF
ncbi:MAG TPA: hypothetical protein DEB46_00885 [Myxococcales bacterium]|nr:hypothetical protein [Myxococcales bacterium]